MNRFFVATIILLWSSIVWAQDFSTGQVPGPSPGNPTTVKNGGTGTTTFTPNALIQGNTQSPLSSSSVTDSGSVVSTPEPISVGGITDTAVMGSIQCAQFNSSGQLLASGQGQCNPNPFIAATITASGTPTHYVAATTVPPGFTVVGGYEICGYFPTASSGAADLNVASTGPVPLFVQNGGGATQFVNGEIPGNNTWNCFQLNPAATQWVQITQPQAQIHTTGGTVSPSGWAAGDQYNLQTAGQVVTLQSLATVPLGTFGQIVISTGDVLATLTASGTDIINNGQVGGGASIIIPADTVAVVNTSGQAGTNAFTVVGLGPVQYRDLTWANGPQLSLNTNGISFGRIATPRIVYGIRCHIDAPTGVAGTLLDVYAMPVGIVPSGTTYKLNVTSCDASSAAFSETNLNVAVAYAQVPAGYWFVALPSGPWPSTLPTPPPAGGITVTFR